MDRAVDNAAVNVARDAAGGIGVGRSKIPRHSARRGKNLPEPVSRAKPGTKHRAVIWLFILALVFRPVRGCLKSVLLLMLLMWVLHRHPDVARDVGQVLEGVERKAKELLEEQSNVSPDRNHVVAPSLV
jgi:hypothetical protein